MPFDFKLHSSAQQLLLYFHLWAIQSCNPNGSSPTSREAQTLYRYMLGRASSTFWGGLFRDYFFFSWVSNYYVKSSKLLRQKF